MDTIIISELRIDTRIGIYAQERQVPQTIQLDLEIGLRGEHAAHSDRIEDTIDYAEVVAGIRRLFAQQHFDLLEHAAESVAQLVIGDFRAPWLRVAIAKLSPLPGVKKLGVTIERGKKT
ncbi:MAG: dihydroneopterin aldolase [Burkholderiales bacterium]|nr:dihydroneopterin aldolase [Burkholderiales bacterium]